MVGPQTSPMPPHSSSQHTSSTPRATVNRKPHPILVGMYLKNSTANSKKSMASIFSEVFRPDAMQWTGLATTPSPASSAQSVQFMSPPDGSVGDQLAFGLKLERALEQRLSHKLVHIYNYQPMHTESSNFQVSSGVKKFFICDHHLISRTQRFLALLSFRSYQYSHEARLCTSLYMFIFFSIMWAK